jgi:Secretion system C-terminal sorting domain
MKKIVQIILVILAVTLTSVAQPQWKFHFAFEDATGAKDTIWCIWDTAATDGSLTSVDTAFGEAGVTFDYSVFNVWINSNVPFSLTDSTKTSAIPFNNTFSIEVKAFNYQYPITISWDSSLFHAPGLPLPVGYVNRAVMDNDYFFLVNNDPPLQRFNLLLDNSVVAPSFFWGSQSQFPLRIGITRDPSIGINDYREFNFPITLFPNPSNEILNIKSDVIFDSYSILSNDLRLIQKDYLMPSEKCVYTINLAQLESGFYSLILHSNDNQSYFEKIVISR